MMREKMIWRLAAGFKQTREGIDAETPRKSGGFTGSASFPKAGMLVLSIPH